MSMRNKALALFLMIIGTAAYGQTIVSQEEVKAAFILNFIKFVECGDSAKIRLVEYTNNIKIITYTIRSTN